VSSIHTKEKEFHDRIFAEDTRQELDKYYQVTERSREHYRAALHAASGPGKRVLEYGCGTAGFSVELRQRGSQVSSIDISSVAILQSREWTYSKSIRDIEFCTMNAESLAFSNGSFDLICGTGILHHLDLEKSYSEVARVLRPGGAGVFLEPLGHNPVINLYRSMTPDMRSEDEHPLLMPDLELAKKYFGKVDCEFFHLHSLAAVPLRKSALFSPALRTFDAIDKVLFAAIPPLRRWAWITVIRLAEPKKS
jgi:ubiquinone/menaquinone biosynthesis C-methylase UbiE